MAEIRFNYGDKFTQTTDTNTGIGSAIPSGKLDVAGNTKAGSLRVSGIATLSSVSGFVNTKLTPTENLIVEAGQSGSVSGEVVIGTGQTISVSTGATTGDAQDFGDLVDSRRSICAVSDAHGGLGGY